MTSVAVSKRQKAASIASKLHVAAYTVMSTTDIERRRYPKSLMTRFFASEFFISHFPSTGPHHALSTNPLHCSHSLHLKAGFTACCCRMAFYPITKVQKAGMCPLMKSISTLCDDRVSIKVQLCLF